MDAGLSEETIRSLDLLVDSLECLEVLVLLCRHPAETFTADRVAAQVGMPPHGALRELERLVRRGLARRTDDDTHVYTDDPAEGAPTADVERIAEAYGTRRIAIVNYVASGALNRIKSLADAFRLKKDPR